MIKRRIIILVVCCSLALSACGKATPTPLTQATMNALYTSVAQTLAVSMPTVTPTPMTTPTPTMTVTPKVTNTVPVIPTPTNNVPVSTCDNSLFVADVTIPDNTAMTAGQAFTKTWSIKNVGTCDWSTSYKLVFLSGEAMSGAATNLPAAITSGHADNVSVKLVAPVTKGTYTGYWIMQNGAGKTFGASMYVTIVVSSSVTATVTGTVTPTPNALATGVSGALTSTANAAGTAAAYAAGTAAVNTAVASTIAANTAATQAVINATATSVAQTATAIASITPVP